MIPSALTEAQHGLWLARRLDPTNPSQNTAQILRIRGACDVDVLRRVLVEVLDECDAFQFRVVESDGSPGLTSEGVAPIAVEVIDLSSEVAPERRALDQIRTDVQRPRDPSSDPMATCIVYRLGPDEHWWYWCAQHLVIDGYGTTLLNTRVMDVFAAALSEREPRTRPFSSFEDVMAEDEAYRASSERGTDRDFWRGELTGMGLVHSLSEGEPLASHAHHRAHVTLPATVVSGLKGLAKDAGCAWPDAAVSAVAAYVKRHIPGQEVVLGVPLMNRLGSVAARVPCTTMNVVPARLSVDEHEDRRDAVARTAEVLRRVRAHGRYRSEEVRRDIDAVGAGRRLVGPLINILPFQPLPALPGLEAELEVLAAGPVDDFTVTLRGGGVGAGVMLEVDSNPALYSPGETREHRDRLLHFLTQYASGSGPVSSVSTLTATEEAHWLYGVNQTDHPVEDTTLVALITRQCRARPHDIAISMGAEWITYAELEERVEEFSLHLRECGAGWGRTVAVLLPRSIEQVVAFVSCMWAGAAYLPLDPDHPPERIRRLVSDARPAAVIGGGAAREIFRESDVVVVSETSGLPSCEWRDDEVVEGWPPEGRGPAPEDTAYVIYTSGSTGTPKGVAVSHRAIVNRLEWMRQAYDFGRRDVILHKTPATFDVSVWELFLPLLCGGRLEVAPHGAHRDPAWLSRLLHESEATAIHFVPSMLARFLDYHVDTPHIGIPRVFCSGEALTTALATRFHQTFSGELYNLYGPTEAAVDVTHWHVSSSDPCDPMPIGRPVWNTTTYVLDERLKPVPPGVMGELYLGGRQLADGYIGRPELTAQSFVPNPHRPGERMYRTGDLAAWRRDGALVFGGRVDHQVKIRGQRVEAGEVEAVLDGLPRITNSVVVLRNDVSGAPGLVAYVTVDGDGVEPEEVRTQLSRLLPEVMVPSVIVPLDALPLTSSGKVDRKALPAPPRKSTVDPRQPDTDTERMVAGIFRDVLGLDRLPGPSDDFFALGGQSLTAIEVLAALQKEGGVEVGASVLFARPTIARLAAAIDESRTAQKGGETTTSMDGGMGLDPLIVLASGPSRPETSIYCIHPAGGLCWCYRAMARAFAGRARVVGLQSPALAAGAATPRTLAELASSYVDRLLVDHPGGPVHLLGWSMGGIVAQAMAVRLQDAGYETGIVALLDAYPADRFRDAGEIHDDEAFRALLLIAGEDPETVPADELNRTGVRARLVAAGHILGSLSDTALDGVVRAVATNGRLVRGHQHEFYGGTVTHFRAGLDHADSDLDASLWEECSGRVEAHVVPFLHAHMTGPVASARIAAVLGQSLFGVGVP